eukprot:Seg14379.1 transcript_id=Seg14379.1/GoldUCD/mRNA.D3Y31 product="Mu-like prophage FluMu DNA transposition protein B" protein_id=Seg14379.1/GoldUCD/D3Y31
MLGCGDTFLSKYINDKLDHPPNNFEATAWDLLKAIEHRLELYEEIFETSVTRQIHGRINLSRRAGNIAVIHGAAGIGKSSASILYAEKNPSTVYRELNARTRDGRAVESVLFNAIEHRDWKGNSSRFEFLVQRFKGSQRTIILDNAHRLNSDGIAWVFDFHSRTGCPFILVANPEIADRILSNDQNFSRVGTAKGFALDDKTIAKVATRVATQFSDEETAKEISDLVTIIAKHSGHLRAVKKTVMLMEALRDLQPDLKDKPRQALRVAHKELLTDFDLPA